MNLAQFDILVRPLLDAHLAGRQFAHALDGLFERLLQLLGVLDRVLGKDNLPLHHLISLALFPSGSAMPFLIDSRIPGTDKRYKVS